MNTLQAILTREAVDTGPFSPVRGAQAVFYLIIKMRPATACSGSTPAAPPRTRDDTRTRFLATKVSRQLQSFFFYHRVQKNDHPGRLGIQNVGINENLAECS
jgi:hypothetical protein